MRRFFLHVSLCLLVSYTSAQTLEPAKGLLSPNAASLGKYGDFNVSYYTGAVDVAIPLYNFSSCGIDLPITLRYDASGVRVNSLPSWVGQNWALQAGGAITRVARGYEDEYYYVGTANTNLGNFHNYFSSHGKINQLVNNPSAFYSITNNGLIGYDFQPDIFIFNFMGMTGKFFLGNDGQWKVESDHNIDVVFDIGDQNNFDYPFIEDCVCDHMVKQCKSIRGFRLRDGNGNTYVFGYNRNAIEYYINIFGQGGETANRPSWLPNCWYLTQVISSSANIIYQLTYYREYHIAHLYPSYQKSKYEEKGKRIGTVHEFLTSIPFAGDLISPVYLESIEDVVNSRKAKFTMLQDEDSSFGSSGEIYFQDYLKYLFIPYLTGACGSMDSYIWNKLQGYVYASKYVHDNPHDALRGLKKMKLIKIAIDNTNKNDFLFSREFLFSYNDNILNKGRLFLTKVTESGITDNKVPTSKEYNFTYRKDGSFPNYMSYKTDHWGYYNGRSAQAYCTTNTITNTAAIYSTKEVNASLLNSGMLETITYPTKGKTAFQYERHDYSKILAYDGQSVYSESGLAGGVRIKQISNYDSDGSLINQKKFYYSETKNGISSGQLSAKPKYHWKWTAPGATRQESITTEVWQITSIAPLSNSFGTHIGYSWVIEEELQSGYTKYKFDNFSDIRDDLPVYSYTQTKPSLYDKRSQKTSMLGRVRKKETYDTGNQLVKEVIYSYDNIDATKFVYTSNVSEHMARSSAVFCHTTGDIYKLYYNKDFLREEITKEYHPNVLTTSTIYKKNDNQIAANGRVVNVRVLSSKETTNSDFSVIKEQYTYPFQLASNNLNSNHTLTALKDRFFINHPIETKTFRNNQLIDYKAFKFDIIGNVVAPVALWTGKSNTTDVIEETKITAFNPLGQARRITNRTSANQEVIWGGRRNELMLAIVENPPSNIELRSKLNTSIINFQNGSKENSVALIEEFNKLRSMYPDSKITSYTYLVNNIPTSITNPRGVTTYFDYDGLGRLTTTKDNEQNLLQNVSYSYQNTPNISNRPEIVSHEIRDGYLTIYYTGCFDAMTTSIKYQQLPSGSIYSTLPSGCYGYAGVQLTKNKTYRITLKIHHPTLVLETSMDVYIP